MAPQRFKKEPFAIIRESRKKHKKNEKGSKREGPKRD